MYMYSGASSTCAAIISQGDKYRYYTRQLGMPGAGGSIRAPGALLQRFWALPTLSVALAALSLVFWRWRGSHSNVSLEGADVGQSR